MCKALADFDRAELDLSPKSSKSTIETTLLLCVVLCNDDAGKRLVGSSGFKHSNAGS